MNRYSGWLFVPALLVTGAFVLGTDGAEWRGYWNGTVDVITGSTVLTGPLTAALAANLAIGQHRLAAVVGSAPFGWMVPYRVALQALMLSGASYVLTALAAIAVTAASDPGGPFGWWALLIGPLVLAACAMAGAAAGHLLPYRVTVLLAAPAVFLLGAFGPHPAAELLRQGPVSGSLEGLSFDPAVWSSQGAGLVAVVMCGAVCVLPWRGRELKPSMLTAAVAGFVALASSLAWSNSVGTDRFVPSDERPTSCGGQLIRVCLAPTNMRNLAATANAMDRAAAILSAGGVALPETYEQLLPGYQPPVEVGMIALDGRADHLDELRSGATYLLFPGACHAWTDPVGPPPDDAFAAQSLIAEWIVMRDGGTPSPFSNEARDWLQQVKDERRNRWVISTFAQLAQL